MDGATGRELALGCLFIIGGVAVWLIVCLSDWCNTKSNASAPCSSRLGSICFI